MLTQSISISEKAIFLSHHSSKNDLVTHLAKYLAKNGIESWYAPRDIRSGEEWDESIHSAIKSCKAMVLLFCAQADSSRQVKRELSLADKYKKPVFWLRVEKVEPNNLSYFLTSTQWLDWLDSRDDTLEKLVRDISELNIANEYDTEHLEVSSNPLQRNHNSTWIKGIFAFLNDRDAAECAARVYFSTAQSRPDSSVVLPTGRSATTLFRAMLRIAKEYNECPFGEAHIFSDTETFGVWNEHETSRTKHIQDMLITPLSQIGRAPNSSQMHLLSGVFAINDPIKETQKNLRLYPPSVHAVSISPVGEILGYEVGTYSDTDEILDDTPRTVEVSEHSKKYIDPNQPSKTIITIGLGTAMAADILLILAFDIQKASIVNRLFNGPITHGIPATLLRNHPNAYLLTTKKVALEAQIDHLCQVIDKPEEVSRWIVSE